MNKPRISIVTPAYNAGEFIIEMLESVQRQSFRDYEHIIIDDGSTDTTAKITKEYAKADKRIIYVKQKNQGPSTARNMGIERAKGEFITFLDADDTYARGTLKTLVEKAEETGADIVYYDFVYYHGDINHSWAGQQVGIDPSKIYTKENLSKKLFNVFPILTCNKLIKTQLLLNNKVRFNTKYLRNEDVDFSIRTTLAAATYAYADYAGYYYRVNNPNSETATNYKHPTQLLQILIDLNGLIESEYPELKQSFDNYAISQVIGSINRQEPYVKVQQKVFNFASAKTIPALGLSNVKDSYVYAHELFSMFMAIREKNYPEMLQCRIRILKDHLEALRAHAEALDNTLLNTNNSLEALQAQNNQRLEEATRLESKLDDVYKSLSWKVTKPLRSIGRIVRMRR